MIPREVYRELSYPGVAHLKSRVDAMLNCGDAMIVDLEVGSKAYDMYLELIDARTRKTILGNEMHGKVIGKGEASAISQAFKNEGIVASNNIKDIKRYVDMLSLDYLTTGDILVEALEKGFISEDEGNRIWRSMLSKKRKLGASSFSQYLDLSR